MPARFDVFLSHASSDKPLVEELARRLARENLRPWLDKWNLIPGTSWQTEIEAALADCAACAVIIGPGVLGPWHHEEMRLAIDRRVGDRERAFRVIPVLLPGVERPERSKLPGLLVATTWVEFHETLDDPEAFHRLVCGIRGIEPGAGPGGSAFEGQNPYRGLELFDVEHAPLFFGREAMTERLLDALKRKPSGAESRFLAIVGASGSGKTSLARAGLMAALKDGQLEGSASWPRAICRPGAEPFFSLAKALTTIAPETVGAVVFDRLQGRKDGERSLHVAAGLVLGEPPRAGRLVLLVDQFEEVFTLGTDEAERRDLIANMLHAATVAGGRTIVVLTMRADFYPRCAAHADLAAALSDHQVLVGPMTEDELRRAIDRPARLAGLQPEPGLVELLVDDVRGRPGALPLLQFTLQELWRRREAHRLTIGAYRDIGEIEGALQRKADTVYAGFTPEQQELCRRIFLRLVQPGEGSEDTRRRASFREVLPDDPAQAEAVRAVIGRLADPETRLLTTERAQPAAGEGTLELAHEALIRGWPQLRTWIETDRAGLRTHHRLSEAAREWADALPEAKESSLHTGARLAEANEWAASHRDELSALEAAFLSASQKHEQQRRADEAEKSRRLAEAERQRAEEAEARKREAETAVGHQKKLSRRFLIAAAVSFLLALAAGLQTWRANRASEIATTAANVAKKNEERAQAQTLIATSRQLAALSASERIKRLDLSLLLAVEALRTKNTFESRDSLSKALQVRPGLKSFLHTREGDVQSVAFSPDGRTLAAGYSSGSGSGEVVLWDLATRQRLAEDPLFVGEGDVESIAFSPDGTTLAAGYTAIIGRGVDSNGVPVVEVGGGVVLWDMAARQRLAKDPLPVREGFIGSVAFSPDGTILAAGYRIVIEVGGGVVLWDVAARQRLADHPLPTKEGHVKSVVFSPNGETLAAGYSSNSGGGAVLWDVATRQRLAEDSLPVEEGDVESVAFSPDGETLAAGYSSSSSGGGVVLWGVAARKRLTQDPLRVNEGVVKSVAFNPNSKILAAGYSGAGGGGAVLWDVAARQRLAEDPFPVGEGLVESVAFSPDGETLAAGYSGGVVLWNVAARNRPVEGPLAVEKCYVESVTFSPDGKTLAAGYSFVNRAILGGGGGGVALWDVATRKRRADLPVKGCIVRSVAFSPGGKTLAAGYWNNFGGGGGAVLWDMTARNRLADLPVIEGHVRSVAFSPDGKTLAAAHSNSSYGVVLWDVAARQRLTEDPLPVEEGDVGSVAFSPDGKTLAAGYSSSSGGAGGVVLWDVAARKRPAENPLPVKEGDDVSVAFSPDGKTLAAGYSGVVGGVVLWDMAACKRLTEDPLPTKEGDVRSVAFSPDGKTLAAGYSSSSGGGAVLWDVAACKRLTEDPLPTKEGYVQSVAYSLDGKTLAAGYSFINRAVRDGDGGGVVLWDVDFESWQHRAARIANRNFTRDEWRQYFPDEPYRPTFRELPVPPEVPANDVTRRR